MSNIQPAVVVSEFNMVTLRRTGNTLRISPTADGREYLENARREDKSGFNFEYIVSWCDLLEDARANGSFEFLTEEDAADLGILSSSPLIGYDIERNDSNVIEYVKYIAHYPDYQVTCEFAEMLDKGFVEFQILEREEEGAALPAAQIITNVVETSTNGGGDTHEIQILVTVQVSPDDETALLELSDAIHTVKVALARASDNGFEHQLENVSTGVVAVEYLPSV